MTVDFSVKEDSRQPHLCSWFACELTQSFVFDTLQHMQFGFAIYQSNILHTFFRFLEKVHLYRSVFSSILR